jgi:hypothetical protein
MSEKSKLPEIQLKRTTDLYQIEAMVEMRRQVDREELITLLRFGRETTEEGSKFTPKKVVEDWLVGFPISSGKRLFRVLEDLELIQRERGGQRLGLMPLPDTAYILTEGGREAEATDSIFLPERVAVILQYVNDPLIPNKITSIQTHKQRLKDQFSRDERGRIEQLKYESIDLPKELEDVTGREIVAYEGDRAGRVVIDSIGGKVIPSKTSSTLQLSLQLSPHTQPKLTIATESQTHDVIFNETIEKQLDYQKVLPNLVRQTGQNWSEGKQAIPVSFNKIDYPQKKSFVSDIQIEAPEIQNLGIFESSTLKSVPVAPRSRGDAQKWYDFLLVDEISTYLTEAGFNNHVDKQKEKFANFGYDLAVPTLQDMVAEFSSLRDDNTYHPIYWFLNAPRDLCLRRGD